MKFLATELEEEQIYTALQICSVKQALESLYLDDIVDTNIYTIILPETKPVTKTRAYPQGGSDYWG